MTLAIGLPARAASAIAASRAAIGSAVAITRPARRLDENDATAVGDDIVAVRDLDFADPDRLAARSLDDAPPRRACRRRPGIDRKAEFQCLVDVARRPIDDHAGNALGARADRQDAAPAGGLDAGPLLDDDDVAGIGRLDGRGAEMPRRGRARDRTECHGSHAAGDALRHRAGREPRDRALEAEPVQCVRDRATIELAQPFDHVLGHGQSLAGLQFILETHYNRHKFLGSGA